MSARMIDRAAVLALSALAITLSAARAQSVGGQATAATVSTRASGAQAFAGARLSPLGGMEQAETDDASVMNTFGAAGLSSMTTGQIDPDRVSVTASAEAANVNVLNGLIAAKAVLALATSYANGTSAASEADGSTLLNLVVAGVAYADGAPGPNTRVALPGVGYVVLNEQIRSGDGVRSSGLTVNMIHVYLIDQVTGGSAGEIIVGAATTTAML